MSEAGYSKLTEANTRYALDFDDAYQLSVARENNLPLATQDKDFHRVRSVLNVRSP